MNDTPAPIPRLCVLTKANGEHEYGFNLHAERGKGQFVGAVDTGSAADMAGLRPGDHIVAVNGESIEGLSHKEVVQRIKFDPNRCSLLVLDEEGVLWFKEHNLPLTAEALLRRLDAPPPPPQIADGTGSNAAMHTEQMPPVSVDDEDDVPDLGGTSHSGSCSIAIPQSNSAATGSSLPSFSRPTTTEYYHHQQDININNNNRSSHDQQQQQQQQQMASPPIYVQILGAEEQSGMVQTTTTRKQQPIDGNLPSSTDTPGANTNPPAHSPPAHFVDAAVDQSQQQQYSSTSTAVAAVVIPDSYQSAATEAAAIGRHAHAVPLPPPGTLLANGPKPRLCSLQKSSPTEEFGFNLHAEKGKGHFIGAVDQDGIADRAGLETGQRIVGVNGRLIFPNTPHKEIVQLIKRDPLRTELLVASEEVDRFYTEYGLAFDYEHVRVFDPQSAIAAHNNGFAAAAHHPSMKQQQQQSVLKIINGSGGAIAQHQKRASSGGSSSTSNSTTGGGTKHQQQNQQQRQQKLLMNEIQQRRAAAAAAASAGGDGAAVAAVQRPPTPTSTYTKQNGTAIGTATAAATTSSSSSASLSSSSSPTTTTMPLGDGKTTKTAATTKKTTMVVAVQIEHRPDNMTSIAIGELEEPIPSSQQQQQQQMVVGIGTPKSSRCDDNNNRLSSEQEQPAASAATEVERERRRRQRQSEKHVIASGDDASDAIKSTPQPQMRHSPPQPSPRTAIGSINNNNQQQQQQLLQLQSLTIVPPFSSYQQQRVMELDKKSPLSSSLDSPPHSHGSADEKRDFASTDIFALNAKEARKAMCGRKRDPRLECHMTLEEKHRLILNL